jgi:argininosuccinate synthase
MGLKSREDCLDYAAAAELRFPPAAKIIAATAISGTSAMKAESWKTPPTPVPEHLAGFEIAAGSSRFGRQVPIELKGISIGVNGMRLDPVSLVELLNEIGGRNATGRIDLVENRFVGIKSRGCYETPGGTLLIAAHRELEALCLERDLMHFKQHIGLKYAELAYFGLWFTPLREALDAFVDNTQQDITGTTTLALYKGNVSVVSRQSENSLYRTDLSSFTMDDSYDQKDAAGSSAFSSCLAFARPQPRRNRGEGEVRATK